MQKATRTHFWIFIAPEEIVKLMCWKSVMNPGVTKIRDDYIVILGAFITAFREAFGNDPSTWPIKLMPASFQAAEVDNGDCANTGNPHDFIGDRLNCNMLEFLGGINLHPYAFDEMEIWFCTRKVLLQNFSECSMLSPGM